ncbi:MAG TPA: glycosyl hydrolase family 28-related protein, partial [Armatimonadota bacterium]|nr:glycosyl hydrolase family 28-related protein [Armatimonadota bacterium]
MPARRSLLVVAVIGVALLRAAHGWADVNVKDFGAVGDGATDDTAAIQAAVEAVGGISQKY